MNSVFFWLDVFVLQQRYLWSIHHPSSFSFPSPPYGLVLLSRPGRTGVHCRSHFICQRACKLSWIHSSENQASGFHMHQEEDKEGPRGAWFKAISWPCWDHNSEIFEPQGTSVCECTVGYSSNVSWGKSMTGAESHHRLCNLNVFWNPWGFMNLLFEHAGFYTAVFPWCTLLQEHKPYYSTLLLVTSTVTYRRSYRGVTSINECNSKYYNIW